MSWDFRENGRDDTAVARTKYFCLKEMLHLKCAFFFFFSLDGKTGKIWARI